MISYGKTDIGKKRSVNQDNIYFSDTPVGQLPNLYIVADGMGGHKAGDYASSYAVSEFVKFVKEIEDTNPISIMKLGIQKINEDLIRISEESEEYNGMGTTFVIAVIVENRLYVANIGDSRLYIASKENIRQITLDHSLVEELIRTGQLDRLKVRNHPEKNIITRALGVSGEAIPDFFEVEIHFQERILMCSDGLSNMIEDDELRDVVVAQDNPEASVNQLIDKANYYGGKDNIAALVIVQ